MCVGECMCVCVCVPISPSLETSLTRSQNLLMEVAWVDYEVTVQGHFVLQGGILTSAIIHWQAWCWVFDEQTLILTEAL